MLRTHTCGELRLAQKGERVRLSGWVQRLRDKGGMVWIDLRDRYGITQLMFEEGSTADDVLETARGVGREFVLSAEGEVIERLSKNDKIPTGDIEIRVDKLEVLNPSLVPPFLIEDETDGGEELRMKYRYLDLRRGSVRSNLELRHMVNRKTREYLDGHGFIEVETPNLIKSTPEGARDFVVPSRMNAGEFYALPQSPQTFKQLLMVSGMDRYYQIVKCFRDEDLRADRQPEFTQIDIEMSFVDEEMIYAQMEGLTCKIFKEVIGVNLPNSFPRLTWDEAMDTYGSDKPDTRFDLFFKDVKPFTDQSEFKTFQSAQIVKGLVIPGGAKYSRKKIDGFTDFVKKYKAKGGGYTS